MSTAGRCMACSTSSGTVVGPGITRNSRPPRTAIGFPEERRQRTERGLLLADDGRQRTEHEPCSLRGQSSVLCHLEFIMPLSGQGMLITIMDADPAEEADFNRWYDREHIIERTAIPGFLESRRYVAVDGAPKYVNFYTTENIAALDSAPYRERLDNPTPWSAHHSPRFRNYTRVVARVTGSKGQGRGGALA